MMALRAYFGGITTQHGLLGCIASSSSARIQFHPCFHRATRGYAAASRSLTKKTPVTAKGARKDARTQPQPPASEEDQMKDLDRMLLMAQFMPTMDPWGQEIQDTLDVMIPYNVNYKSYTRETYNHLKSNLTNSFKNAAALSTLVSANSVPGVTTLYRKSFMQKIRDIKQIFGTQSVKPDSLVAPFRQMALDLYMHMNDAIAKRNEKDIIKLTTSSYQKHALEMLKFHKTKHANTSLFWQMHREFEPTRILSLRVIQGHLGDEEPRFGNRLMVHALLKFDTEQSLEIYNQQGHALHVPASAAQRSSNQRVPAQRKRVTEYLVMEKRMWLQGPWIFREQLWPSASA